MKLRVIISQNNIQVLQLPSVPDCIEDFKEFIRSKYEIEHDFVLQYIDKDFDEFVNLNETAFLENLMTIKVVPDEPENPGTSDTSTDQDDVISTTSNLRKSGWPLDGYRDLPAFDVEIEGALMAYQNTQSVVVLPKNIKTKILDCLANQIYKISPYPNQKQLTQVAQALVNAYPCLRDSASPTGCQVWVNSLTYKMGAYRTKMRGYGCKELQLNANRSSHNKQSLPPAKNIKKARRGEVNWQPDYPDGEDETTMEIHKMAMQTEMEKESPYAAKLNRLMAITYAKRRLEINGELPVSTIVNGWPALFRQAEIYREYTRLVSRHIRSDVMEGLGRISHPLLEILHGMTTGKVASALKQDLDLLKAYQLWNTTIDTTCYKYITALRCLPLYFGDAAHVLYRDFMNATSDEEITEEDWPPFIAVIGNPLTSNDHRIVIGQTVIIKSIKDFPEAVCIFLAMIYILNIKYNSPNTFEFMQHCLLKLPKTTTNTKKVTTLLAKLPPSVN